MGFTKREWIGVALSLLLIAGGLAYSIVILVRHGKERRRVFDTMRSMARIAQAYTRYRRDAKYGLADPAAPLPTAGPGWIVQKRYDEPKLYISLPYAYRASALKPLLVPKYIDAAVFQPIDSWGQEVQLATKEPLPLRAGAEKPPYAMRSGAANGKFDDPIITDAPKSWDDDMVLYEGSSSHWGSWYGSQITNEFEASVARDVNSAAALIAKRGPSCDLLREDWFGVFVISPDGQVVCPLKYGHMPAVDPLFTSEGWVKDVYVKRVTASDGKPYIVCAKD